MLAVDIESRLDEWSRWSRSYGRRRNRAQSAEGAWRSPQHWYEVTRAPPASIVVWRAMEVERAVVALPDPFGLCIVLVYVRRAPDEFLRWRLKQWKVRHVQPVLDEARQRLGAALAIGQVISYLPRP